MTPPREPAEDGEVGQDEAVSDPETPASPGPDGNPEVAAATPRASTPAQSPVDRSLPPDPAAYDSPRAALARERGLSAPYIAGGRDPEPEEGLNQDRYYGRLLVLMVVALILMGFVLGILGNVITALRGG